VIVAHDKIIEKLRQCLDPELGINIVDLGLIYSVNVEGNQVHVLMTLTTPGCPLDSYFTKDITSKLKSIKGIADVAVELTFEPPWSPTKMSDESKDLLGFVN
jgi:metal-sulfur cluster biosynthetic enzyme